MCGQAVTDHLFIICLLVIDGLGLTIFSFYDPVAVVVNIHCFESPEITDRVADLDTGKTCLYWFAAIATIEITAGNGEVFIRQGYQLVFVGGIIHGSIPHKIFCFYGDAVHLHLYSLVVHRSGVGRHFVVQVRWRRHGIVHEQVGSMPFVDVNSTGDAVFQEAEVNTDICFLFLFPAQVGVGIGGLADTLYPLPVAVHVGIEVKQVERAVVAGWFRTCNAEAATQFQAADDIHIFHKTFFFNIPPGGNSGEIPPFMIGAKPGRALVTYAGHQHIFSFKRIVQPEEIAYQLVFHGSGVFRRFSSFQCQPRLHLIVGVIVCGEVPVLHPVIVGYKPAPAIACQCGKLVVFNFFLVVERQLQQIFFCAGSAPAGIAVAAIVYGRIMFLAFIIATGAVKHVAGAQEVDRKIVNR